MGFAFTFHSLEDMRQLRELISFISEQPLSYPRYDIWVEKSEDELRREDKHAYLAWSGRKLVGDVVYQTHKSCPSFLEIKNLRIHPDMRNRMFASFLLKQLELENARTHEAILCDARADQVQTVQFMVSQGYNQLPLVSFYDSSVPDIPLIKFLRRDKAPQLRTSAERILY